MNSQPSISYSTSYTLWGLSRRYLAVLTRDINAGSIINGVALRNFRSKSETYAWRGGVPKCVIVDVRSIFEVQFLSDKFSLYMVMVGLRNFSRYNVRA